MFGDYLWGNCTNLPSTSGHNQINLQTQISSTPIPKFHEISIFLQMHRRAARGVQDELQAKVREEGAVRHHPQEKVPQNSLPDLQK